jgi:hypothetical protein
MKIKIHKTQDNLGVVKETNTSLGQCVIRELSDLNLLISHNLNSKSVIKYLEVKFNYWSKLNLNSMSDYTTAWSQGPVFNFLFMFSAHWAIASV